MAVAIRKAAFPNPTTTISFRFFSLRLELISFSPSFTMISGLTAARALWNILLEIPDYL